MNDSVLITEFITGGGFASGELIKSLFPEGFSMLRALVEDWNKMGFNVVSTLDSRMLWIENLMNVDFTTVSSSNDYFDTLEKLSREVEHVICVAPETDGLLERCVKIFSETKGPVFHGPAVRAVQSLSNKHVLAKFCYQNGIKMPTTFFIPLLSFNTVRKALDTLKTPEIVIKPVLGAGSEDITIITDGKLDNVPPVSNPSRGWVIQPFIRGNHHSATFLANKETVYLLSVNNQNLKINQGLYYYGGSLPAIDSKREIIQIPLAIVRLIKGICNSFDIRGYFGVDFILQDTQAYVIEVNLRPTTPITVFSKVSKVLPTKLLVKREHASENPEKTQDIQFVRKDHLVSSTAVFSKVCISSKHRLDADHLISLYRENEELDAPLFLVDDHQARGEHSKFTYAGMISVIAKNAEEAWKKLDDKVEKMKNLLI
ncbi:MAG: ATP-grasp domain-containing protein [Candidatus Hodarchaeales archaeon]|jgi:predicted ATP-grasp superfamily ATP-dependent carboligase